MSTDTSRDQTRKLFLLSAGYNGTTGKAYLKLLDPKRQEIVIWNDPTGHQPFCYSRESLENLKKDQRLTQAGAIGFLRESKFDLLEDRPIEVTKIVASDPLAVGGREGCIRELVDAWEADIPYHLNYMYDRGLVPGMPYSVQGNDLIPLVADRKQIDPLVEKLFAQESLDERREIRNWLLLLEADQPEVKHVSLDIEVVSSVFTRVPSPGRAEDPVASVALRGSDGLKKVLMLKRDLEDESLSGLPFDVQLYENEKDLLKDTFNIIERYPLLATFNGDDFDLPYLRNRAERLGVEKSCVPVLVGRQGASLKRGIHIDLYRLFFNKSLQVYAFNNAYRENTLEAVAQGVLGRGKVEIEKPIAQLSPRELANYNFGDAELLHSLLSYHNDLILRLLVVLCRISKLTIEDVCRQGVSGWIKNLLFYEHRARGYLIPRSEDILEVKDVTSTKAVIEGKKYRGAIVVKPIPGMHFNVTVLDFASLYPSALKEWNLSYETVRCPHMDCRRNTVPETTHWICTKRKGLESLVVGSLRDIRVAWYKPKSSDEQLPEETRTWYSVVQRALKVFLNASYGVFGAQIFPLYCPPVAESTAAIGRHAFTGAIEKARELGVKVIYGDTDSIFLETDDKNLIKMLIGWATGDLKLDLEVDKVYRYVVFSTRKKNYLGVTTSNVVDVKGLTGKKRHVPIFIKKAFDDMVERLRNVHTAEDLAEAKREIEEILREWYHKLNHKEFSLEDVSFHMMMSRAPDRYVKTTPQHVKAARKLQDQGLTVSAGDIISFVKTRDREGVQPLQFARKEDVDLDKYMEYLESAFDQVLDTLGLDFNSIKGISSLEDFF